MDYSNKSTNELIIHSFLIMGQEKPIHRIKVNDLCNKTGISRTTFYRYYDSIYDLADELENFHIDGFLRIAKAHNKNNTSLEQYMREILGYIKEEEVFFKCVLSVYSDNHFVARWKKIMYEDVLKEYQMKAEKLSGRQKVSLEMMISGVIGAYSQWLFHQSDVSLAEVLQLILKIWDFYRM